MRAAILAAGVGTRLKDYLRGTPKPLVRIGGIPLIQRVIDQLTEAGIDDIIVISRRAHSTVHRFLNQQVSGASVRLVIKDTRAGFFSLMALERYLSDASFLLCATDSIWGKGSVCQFTGYARSNADIDLIVGVSDFIHDIKPVYVVADTQGNVNAFGRDVAPTKYVSAGLYYCSPKIFQERYRARKHNIQHLSDFFSFLIGNIGYKAKSFYLGKVVDVDDENDIKEAEHLLLGEHQI